MLRGALYKDQLVDLLVEVVCRPLLEGYLLLDYWQLLAGGRLVGLSKVPKEGVLPICIGDLFCRLVAYSGVGQGSTATSRRHIQW